MTQIAGHDFAGYYFAGHNCAGQNFVVPKLRVSTLRVMIKRDKTLRYINYGLRFCDTEILRAISKLV